MVVSFEKAPSERNLQGKDIQACELTPEEQKPKVQWLFLGILSRFSGQLRSGARAREQSNLCGYSRNLGTSNLFQQETCADGAKYFQVSSPP
jgi:hypothetical protein